MPNEHKILKCRGREIKFGAMPLFMGVINVTPDSFSDGGRLPTIQDAVDRAIELLADGATIIDIGGESTRPGAEAVSADEQISRVEPVIKKLRSIAPECFISIDTRDSRVAAAALSAGVDIVNDVSGLSYDLEIAAVAAKFDAGLILMHMRGLPSTMQNPENLIYQNITEEVKVFLNNATQKAIESGVKRENLIIDPGIGFAKDLNGNRCLLREIHKLKELNYPLLVGFSRKKFIGEVLSIDNPDDRIFGAIGIAAHVAAEVEIIRLHDIKPFKEALTMFLWCKQQPENE